MTDTVKGLDDGQNIKENRLKFSKLLAIISFQYSNIWDSNVMHTKEVLFLP